MSDFTDFFSAPGDGCSVDGGNKLRCPFDLHDSNGGEMGAAMKTAAANLRDVLWGVVNQNGILIVAVLTLGIVLGLLVLLAKRFLMDPAASQGDGLVAPPDFGYDDVRRTPRRMS